MKLSEIKPIENIKVLLIGPPGTGKTCTAAGFPYPMRVLDFDGKVNSAARWYAGDVDRLANIDVEPLSKRLDGRDPVLILLQEINELIAQEKSGVMKYKTLVIDSMTTFSDAVINHIVQTNPGIKRFMSKQGAQPCQQDFGILKREFARLIPGILSLPMNIVVTAHIKTDKSELTGEIIRSPLMDGSFGTQLPVYFDECYRTYMENGKVFAQTQSDAYYNFCRSSIPGLPAKLELKYENLIKKYK